MADLETRSHSGGDRLRLPKPAARCPVQQTGGRGQGRVAVTPEQGSNPAISRGSCILGEQKGEDVWMGGPDPVERQRWALLDCFLPLAHIGLGRRQGELQVGGLCGQL